MNRRILALLTALLCSTTIAKADFAFTVGSGQTAFSFTASTGGTAICAASVTHCFASVPINTAGAAFFTSGAPGLVTLTGTNNIATVTTVTGVTTVSTVTTLSTLTGGGIASGSADSGNPVKIGGVYNVSPITLINGNRGDIQLDVNGYTKVNVTNTLAAVANNADAVAAGTGCCSPVANYNFVWNGSTWDRQAGTTSGTKITAASGAFASGAVVDITNMSGTTAAAVPAKAVYAGVNVAGNIVGLAPGTAGSAGTQVFSVQGIASMTPVLATLTSATTGGATAYTPFVPAASDNHQTVKNGAGTVYSMSVSNNSATKNYARLYDSGTGFNGCNSATGVIFAFEIPPTDSGFTIMTGGVNGLAFSNGLSLCITSGFGLTDTTNATATAMYVNVAYK